MAPDQGKTGSRPGRGEFHLYGLEWTAPDRLEVTGEFMGLAVPPDEAPVLVVHGAEGEHRLPAVPESVSGTPDDGQPWRAEFAWEVAPFAFDAATLEIGDTVLVELLTPEASDAAPAASPAGGPGAERLHLQAEMVVAQAATREARAEVERLRTELARATEDLESERSRLTRDADRFREGLSAVEASAREALEAARAEVVALRERVAELERSGEEVAQAQAAHEQAKADAQSARTESERLAGQLARIREALDDPV